ncbi:MAG: hypothetical protein VB071_11640 [Lawsonibacter sp.]|nr:hypothetical protein [Lawsonibacter sp.]
MRKKLTQKKLPQLTLLLRMVGGAYLLYLAWGLRQAAFSDGKMGYLVALIVFSLAGTVLLAHSVRLLAKGEFLLPWELPEDDGEGPETEDTHESD